MDNTPLILRFLCSCFLIWARSLPNSFFQHFVEGMANPWHKKKFLRPRFESRISDFSLFWVYFFSFFILSGQKVYIFSQILNLRPRNQPWSNQCAFRCFLAFPLWVTTYRCVKLHFHFFLLECVRSKQISSIYRQSGWLYTAQVE